MNRFISEWDTQAYNTKLRQLVVSESIEMLAKLQSLSHEKYSVLYNPFLLEHQWQVPLQGESTLHQLVSPKPLQESPHKRVGRDQLPKPLWQEQTAALYTLIVTWNSPPPIKHFKKETIEPPAHDGGLASFPCTSVGTLTMLPCSSQLGIPLLPTVWSAQPAQTVQLSWACLRGWSRVDNAPIIPTC